MGIFTSIKEAIFGKDEPEAPATRTPTPRPVATSTARSILTGNDEVDVEARLDNMAGADKLNWRNSIVDLMKLVGLDASYENRKELATELGDSDYSGKGEENVWLHRQVMNKLAANGGRVPADLRD